MKIKAKLAIILTSVMIFLTSCQSAGVVLLGVGGAVAVYGGMGYYWYSEYNAQQEDKEFSKIEKIVDSVAGNLAKAVSEESQGKTEHNTEWLAGKRKEAEQYLPALKEYISFYQNKPMGFDAAHFAKAQEAYDMITKAIDSLDVLYLKADAREKQLAAEKKRVAEEKAAAERREAEQKSESISTIENAYGSMVLEFNNEKYADYDSKYAEFVELYNSHVSRFGKDSSLESMKSQADSMKTKSFKLQYPWNGTDEYKILVSDIGQHFLKLPLYAGTKDMGLTLQEWVDRTDLRDRQFSVSSSEYMGKVEISLYEEVVDPRTWNPFTGVIRIYLIEKNGRLTTDSYYTNIYPDDWGFSLTTHSSSNPQEVSQIMLRMVTE